MKALIEHSSITGIWNEIWNLSKQIWSLEHSCSTLQDQTKNTFFIPFFKKAKTVKKKNTKASTNCLTNLLLKKIPVLQHSRG